MKIRTGFVSNSSSSNFIVDNTYDTVFDLAKAMLKIRDDSRDDLSISDKKKFLVEINNIDKAIGDGRNPNNNIYFSTCNYDTYIKKILGFYIVTTCNNVSFIDDLEGIVYCPVEIRKWLEDNKYLSDYDRPIPFTEDIETWKFQCEEVFWSPKYDLELSRYDYMTDDMKDYNNAFCKNKNHWHEKMILASTKEIICPICYCLEQENKQPRIENRFDILDL